MINLNKEMKYIGLVDNSNNIFLHPDRYLFYQREIKGAARTADNGSDEIC